MTERYIYTDSQFLPAMGMRVHYRLTGEGPTIVLLHGLSSSLHTWDAWHNELSEHYSVLSLDLPGFGLTGPFPGNDYSLDHYLDLLDAVMDSLGIPNWYLVGNSFGGLLAWHYALRAPHRVNKLVLLNASGYPRDSIPSHYRLAMSPMTRWLTYWLTPRSLVSKAVQRVYGDPSLVTEALVDRYYALLTRPGNRQGYSKLLRTIMPPLGGDAALIKKITQPTLILWGERDQVIPPAHAYLFERDIEHAKLIMYAGVGHIPMEERPQQTAHDVHQFLQYGA